jgi:hypothetical protein
MTAPRNPTRLIEAFLEDGTDLMPDWAYDEVRRDIHRTHQRVVIGPWREPDMSNLARYGVIAAAVVLLVGAGVVLLRPAPAGVAAPPSVAPTASPTASPSASDAAAASPTMRPDALPPGPATISDTENVGPATLTVTIPEGAPGWTSTGNAIWKDYGPSGTEDGPAIVVWPGGITGTYVDPCFDHTLKQPDPTGVAELIAALGEQKGITGSPPVDVTISGYVGQYVATVVTQDISACDGGMDGFWLWDGKNSDRRYVQGTGEINQLYAFDVDGNVFTFDVRLPKATTADDRAEVEAMLETLVIEPVVTPSPSP